LASLTSVSAFKEVCLVFADVFVDVPDELDISSMRGQGLQPDEQLLPETAGPTDQVGAAADEAIVAQLATMGFPRLRCEKAAIQTSNTGLEEAMTWLLAHMDDPDVDEPFRGAQEFQAVDEVNLETLVSFGFKPDVACKALRATVGMTISIFMLL
jgi:ubiquitin carboxyl-terminal hydrolase 5/13